MKSDLSSVIPSGVVGSRYAARRPRGQSLAEFAILIPVMLLILMIAVDFGRVFLGWVNVNNMARIGANFAAINATAWQSPDTSQKQSLRARYATLMQADATAINCSLPSPLPPPIFYGLSLGSSVEVSVNCAFPLVTPFLSALVGDGNGNIQVNGSTRFTIRSGSVAGVAVGESVPTPSPSPSPVPTPSPTPTPDPSGEPLPTLPPVTVDFYGTPTSSDSEGGGPNPTPGMETIVGVPTLSVQFRNETTGNIQSCLWTFGDGTASTSCSGTVSKNYAVRGTYSVTLTVNGQSMTRPDYVLVGCKVPSFAGVRKSSAQSVWVAAGFGAGNINFQAGSGNYLIGYQNPVGGMLNPPGGCSGAVLTVGP